MKIDVIYLPAYLVPSDVQGHSVVVFDVLRATTTMAAALAAGIREIRIFDSVASAAAAAGRAGVDTDQSHKQNATIRSSASEGQVDAGAMGAGAGGEFDRMDRVDRVDQVERAKQPAGELAGAGMAPLLCGEVNCLAPSGFDLGNSPGAFKKSRHDSRSLFMATTNGTRAIIAARGAALMFTGAIVNASAVAELVIAGANDVTLLCAGTAGAVAMEDVIGAGAVLEAIGARTAIDLSTDSARMARRLFLQTRDDLHGALVGTTGGQNILRVNMPADIEFAARLDFLDVAGRVYDAPLRVLNAAAGAEAQLGHQKSRRTSHGT